MSESNKPIPMRLTATVAEKRIHELAQDSNNVIFGDHSNDRAEEREITDLDVLRVLRTGFVDDDPVPTERGGGEWKVKITKRKPGSNRTVGVVTIILINGKLFVKTREWEDLK